MLNYTVKYNGNEIYSSSGAIVTVPIKYNENTITTLTTPTNVILPVKDKYCQGNIQVGNIILPTNDKCNTNNLQIITKYGVPAEYQEVEYIQSTGTQYIKLNSTLNQINKVYTKWAYTTRAVDTYIFGGRDTNGRYKALARQASAYKIRLLYNATEAIVANYDPAVNEIFEVEADFTSAAQKLYVNGNLMGSSTYTQTDASVNCTIFAFWAGTQAAAYSSSRCYLMKIYDLQNNLLHYLIPCYRKSDSIPGLYDACGEQFYTNAGTGVFILGSPVKSLPKTYQEVEYLQSSGSQYINTLFSPTQNTRFSIDVMPLDLPGGPTGLNTIFGSELNNARLGLNNCYTNSYQFYYTSGSGHRNYNATLTQNVRCKLSYTGNILVEPNGATVSISQPSAYTAPIMYINAHNGSTSTIYYGNNKYYNFQILEGLLLQRNFVPCYRKADSKPGLYDIVNSIFYINQGTGADFTVGPDVN